MEVKTRVVPQRTLAVIAREVRQPDLDSFIKSAFDELFAWAERNPGLRAIATTPDDPTYAIFHGPVTPEESALVEVCIVISASAEVDGNIELRVEPEHLEAYTVVTKEGLEFPAILEAYDAVAMWVNNNGQMVDELPSREVYFADVIAASPGDPVADIAFPYREAQ